MSAGASREKKQPPRKAVRRALCAHYGVPNTGRQWRRIRKWMRATRHAAAGRL